MIGDFACMRRAAAALATLALLVPGIAGADETMLSRKALARADLYIESAVQMAEFLALSRGEKARATCIDQYYFGSPIFPRDVANVIWKWSQYPAVSVLGLLLNKACAQPEDPDPIDPRYWVFPLPEDAVLPDSSDIEAMVAGAIWFMAAQADLEENTAAGDCAAALYGSRNVYARAADLVEREPPQTVQHVVYRLVRENCQYPKGGLAALDVPFAPSERLVKAAAERVMAAKDLETCEEKYSEEDRKSCVRLMRKLRRMDIASEMALSETDEKLKEAQDQLEEVRRNAWRLPDGRLIFRDGNKWRFENGDFVPADLAVQRVPPPE